MNFVNRFQLNYKRVDIPSSVLNSKFISYNLKMTEPKKSQKKRNTSLFNNRVRTATYQINTNKPLKDLKAFRIKSNYSLKRNYGLYETSEISSIEDKLSKINHSSFNKFKNSQINLKKVFITSNFDLNNNLNSSRNDSLKKTKNLLTEKKYYSFKEINENNKNIIKNRLYFNKTPTPIFNKIKIFNALNNLTEQKVKLFSNNFENDFNNLTIKRQYTEDVVTDNLKDLVQALSIQTVNNFNNKYHVKYKANNLKNKNKITKIFEILKNNDTKLKSVNEMENNHINCVRNGRNSNSFLGGIKNNNTHKKTMDISVGTDDILFNKCMNLKQKQKGRNKNKSLRIHTLNLVNVIK